MESCNPVWLGPPSSDEAIPALALTVGMHPEIQQPRQARDAAASHFAPSMHDSTTTAGKQKIIALVAHTQLHASARLQTQLVQFSPRTAAVDNCAFGIYATAPRLSPRRRSVRFCSFAHRKHGDSNHRRPDGPSRRGRADQGQPGRGAQSGDHRRRGAQAGPTAER